MFHFHNIPFPECPFPKNIPFMEYHFPKKWYKFKMLNQINIYMLHNIHQDVILFCFSVEQTYKMFVCIFFILFHRISFKQIKNLHINKYSNGANIFYRSNISSYCHRSMFIEQRRYKLDAYTKIMAFCLYVCETDYFYQNPLLLLHFAIFHGT